MFVRVTAVFAVLSVVRADGKQECGLVHWKSNAENNQRKMVVISRPSHQPGLVSLRRQDSPLVG